MSVLRPGDEKLHYSDNAHRWIAPTDEEQASWNEALLAHLAAHTEYFGVKARQSLRLDPGKDEQ